MLLPAVLFPDPARPSNTRRSSSEDTGDMGTVEGDEVKVGTEGEEEKTID